jgi:hypothetical protein
MIERHYRFRQLRLGVSGALAGLACLAALAGPAGAQEPPFRGVPLIIAPIAPSPAPAAILQAPTALSLQPTLTAPPSVQLPKPPVAAKAVLPAAPAEGR